MEKAEGRKKVEGRRKKAEQGINIETLNENEKEQYTKYQRCFKELYQGK